MPKAKGFNRLAQEAKNKIPPGFFSTLDELIEVAPFEEATVEQWQHYLKPGMTLERGGVKFPLKKEELEYSGVPGLFKAFGPEGTKDQRQNLRRLHDLADEYPDEHPGRMRRGTQKLSRSMIQSHARRNRPVIAAGETGEEAGFKDWAHKPGGPSRGFEYRESLTNLGGMGSFPTHFDPSTVSHSRSTTLPSLEERLVRLVEEIQSDRHSAAAERIPNIDKIEETTGLRPDENLRVFGVEGLAPEYTKRRGYRTPEDEVELENLHPTEWGTRQRQRADEIRRKPPDAPFKDPQDYATLELKKQLLGAIGEDADFLALTRGQDQIDRYGMNRSDMFAETADDPRRKGMEYMYDQIYPSRLRKLAQQYGAKDLTEVEVPVRAQVDTRPATLVDFDMESPDQLIDSVIENQDTGPLANLIDDYARGLETPIDDPMMVKIQENLEELQDLFGRHKGGNAAALEESLRFDSGPLSQERYDHFMAPIELMHSRWMKKFGTDTALNKKFPALELTPQLKELVKKVGIPIWALSGAAVLPGEEEETHPGMAEGGKVSATAQALKRLSQVVQGEKPKEGLEDMLHGLRSVQGAKPQTREELARLKALRARATETQNKPRVKQLEDRMLDHLAETYFSDDVVSKAEGGVVEESKNKPEEGMLERLAALARKLGAQNKSQESRARIASGLASQLWGLDPETGEADNPLGVTIKMEDGTPAITFRRPGIVDETLALPTLIDMFKDKGEEPDAPAWARRAAERQERLRENIRKRMKLKPAEGFSENFDESLGVMLGQIPMPASAAKNAAKLASAEFGPRLAKLSKQVRMPAEPLAEWLMPTVVPRVENYLLGSGFGGTVGALTGSDEPEQE